MSARMALVLLVVFLATPVGADEPDPRALEAMQGTWTMLSFTSNGDAAGADTIDAASGTGHLMFTAKRLSR